MEPSACFCTAHDALSLFRAFFEAFSLSSLQQIECHTKTVAKNKYSRNKVAFEIIQCVKKTRDYADANVFMRPFEIYRAALYNVYGGSRVTDVPYIYNNKHNNYMDCERLSRLCGARSGSPQLVDRYS